MSHAANSSFVAGGGDNNGRLPGTWSALAIVSIAIAPIAIWQFGVAGATLVAGFAAVMVLTCWLAERAEARFERQERSVAGVLAASGVRMGVPLVVALLFLLLGRELAPVSAVLLLVPLYLSALVAETFGHVRPGGIAAVHSRPT